MVRPGSLLWHAHGTLGAEQARLVVKLRRFIRPEDAAQASMRERVIREFDALDRLHRALESQPGISVPQPVLCLPDQMTLVLEEKDGRSLQDLILDYTRNGATDADWERLARAFRAAGRYIALQQDLLGLPHETLDVGELLAYNEDKIDRLERLGGIPPEMASVVRAENCRLGGLVGNGRQRAAVVTHGDYSPGNVLLHDETIVVLDFGMAGRGSIFQDLSYCHEYLERYLMRYHNRPRQEIIRRLEAALLEGYDPQVHSEMPLFRLGQMRHQLNYLLNSHEPTTGLRRYVRKLDRARGLRSLRAWVAGKGLSPATGRT